MGTIIFRTLVGAVAGLIVWALAEPGAPTSIADPRWGVWERGFVTFLFLAIGMAVSGLSGYLQGGKQHTIRGLVIGGILGMVGGLLGYSIGGGLSNALLPGALTSGVLPIQMMGRVVALAPVGLGLGLAIGASTLNAKRAIQGGIGGLLGGLVAGVSFDIIGEVLGQFVLTLRGQQTGEVGGLSRAMTALLLGGAIALFIGLVERFARSAWIRLRLGRNEGKEWSLDSVQNFIGRSEGAQIPLFGDPNVAPMHAMIQKSGPNWMLVDGGSPMGTVLNGQRVMGQALLAPGSVIQIGSFVLEFLTKNAPAPARGPEQLGNMAYPMTQNYPPSGMPPYQTMSGPAPQPMQPTMVSPQPMPTAMPPTQAMPPNPNAMMPTQMSMPAPMAPTVMGGQIPAGFVLVALDGPLTGQRFPVGGPLELGRGSAQVPMSYDAQASRRHAVVTPTAMGVSVADQGSTNGTFLNNQRVTQANAGPGDVLKIGSTNFRVERN